PGPGGYAAILQKDGQEKIVSGGHPHTTNNRMEMMAMIRALQLIKKHFPRDTIEIFSDSKLLIESLTKNWKRKKNLDLWAELDEAKRNVHISFQWVKGHSTNFQNNRADRLAVKEAEKQKRWIRKTDSHTVLM
ncbi:ribonuclease HI, partial [Candidatus Peregrinibacteria bacterium]|nr:ribonuclease HI [Candidatus Peregrinibacteria bacterium]